MWPFTESKKKRLARERLVAAQDASRLRLLRAQSAPLDDDAPSTVVASDWPDAGRYPNTVTSHTPRHTPHPTPNHAPHHTPHTSSHTTHSPSHTSHHDSSSHSSSTHTSHDGGGSFGGHH